MWTFKHQQNEFGQAPAEISLTELVDPIDYEDFLQQHSNMISRDPLRNILDFPANDVQMRTIERKIRTVEPIVPKEHM